MISRIKKLWNGLCDILEGPGEYSAPDLKSPGIDLAAVAVITFDPDETDYSHGGPWDDWPLRWALVKGGKFSHIGYTRRQESIHRDPGFSESLDLF